MVPRNAAVLIWVPVLLMAPLHHHFEMMGWSETKIMLRFWIIAGVCSGLGFAIYQQSIGT